MLNEIPIELVSHILSFLPLTSTVRVAQTSRSMRNILEIQSCFTELDFPSLQNDGVALRNVNDVTLMPFFLSLVKFGGNLGVKHVDVSYSAISKLGISIMLQSFPNCKSFRADYTLDTLGALFPVVLYFKDVYHSQIEWFSCESSKGQSVLDSMVQSSGLRLVPPQCVKCQNSLASRDYIQHAMKEGVVYRLCSGCSGFQRCETCPANICSACKTSCKKCQTNACKYCATKKVNCVGCHQDMCIGVCLRQTIPCGQCDRTFCSSSCRTEHGKPCSRCKLVICEDCSRDGYCYNCFKKAQS